jgi:hypothetical protein
MACSLGRRTQLLVNHTAVHVEQHRNLAKSVTVEQRVKLPIVVLACQVLQEMMERLLPPGAAASVKFLSYGLHRSPPEMNRTLQMAIDAVERPSRVVLGYGLCGNGLNGLRSGAHTLLVPRVNDCIALLLGSRERYVEEFGREPGTYYLSRGWLEAGSDPLREYERYVPLYGEEEAMWLMDVQYRHYRRLALVAQSPDDLQASRPRAREVAAFCARWGMVYEEILGSDGYVRRLIEVALSEEAPGEDFLLVPPGGEIHQAEFLC